MAESEDTYRDQEVKKELYDQQEGDKLSTLILTNPKIPYYNIDTAQFNISVNMITIGMDPELRKALLKLHEMETYHRHIDDHRVTMSIEAEKATTSVGQMPEKEKGGFKLPWQK